MNAEQIADAIYKYCTSKRYEIVQIGKDNQTVTYKTWVACEKLGELLEKGDIS